MKFSTLLLLSLPLTTAVVRPVEQEATLLHAVATASHNIMVDLCDYPELCACIKELAVHHDLSEVSAALCELHEMVAAGQTQVSVGLLKAVIDELMLLENRVANDLATLSLQLAATGIGSNYASSTAPFTTEIAGQNATNPAATQTVNIGVASAGAGAGLNLNIGTGYTTQTPQTIEIGGPNTTTTFNGNVVWTNAGLSTSSLTSAGAATITTRSGGSGGTQRVFTFDSSTALGGNPTLYQQGGQTLVIGEKATAGSSLTLYSGTTGAVVINDSNSGAQTLIGTGTTTGRILIGGTAGQLIDIGQNGSTTAAATNTSIGEQNSVTAGGSQAVNIGTGSGTALTTVSIGNTGNTGNSVNIVGSDVYINTDAGQSRTYIGTNTTTGSILIGGRVAQEISIGINTSGVTAAKSTNIGLQNSNNVGATQTVNIGTGTGTAQTTVEIGNSAGLNNAVKILGSLSDGVQINGGVQINTTGFGATSIGHGTIDATLNGNVLINNNNTIAQTFIGTGTTSGAVIIGGTAGQLITIGSNDATTLNNTQVTIGAQYSTAGGAQILNIGRGFNPSTQGVFIDIARNATTTTQVFQTLIGEQNSNNVGAIQTVSIGTGTGTAQTSVTIGNTNNAANAVQLNGPVFQPLNGANSVSARCAVWSATNTNISIANGSSSGTITATNLNALIGGVVVANGNNTPPYNIPIVLKISAAGAGTVTVTVINAATGAVIANNSGGALNINCDYMLFGTRS